MAWLWTHPRNQRWYRVGLQRDLLGALHLVATWGGPQRATAASKSVLISTREQLRSELKRHARRRHARGYIDTRMRADAPQSLQPP